MMWGRNPEVTRRTAERRQREDEAPRLAMTIPALQGLRLEVLEHSPSISHPEYTHVRHVVVASAPALFVMPCRDKDCKDGGHDLTQEILAALRRRNATFEGEDVCRGMVGSTGCSRILGYVAAATYQG
jgi:DNA-binding LacI/PurR family transcriptional regulator